MAKEIVQEFNCPSCGGFHTVKKINGEYHCTAEGCRYGWNRNPAEPAPETCKYNGKICNDCFDTTWCALYAPIDEKPD